jgi:hypothetical protein
MNDSPPPDATLKGGNTLLRPVLIPLIELSVVYDTNFPGEAQGILDGMHPPLTAVNWAGQGIETVDMHWLASLVYS